MSFGISIKTKAMPYLISFISLLIIIAVVYLVIYLFSKYVSPIDPNVKGIIIFIVAMILIVYLLTGGTLMFWRK